MRTVTGGILTAMSTGFFGVRSFIQRMGSRLANHPAGVVGALIVAIGIFAVGHNVMAQGELLSQVTKIATGGPQAWVGFVVVLINALLYQILDLLIQLNIVITDILISIVQFNTFVGARPVDLGWPLVRDVVNMFFIVVLLVIAFSTIIGYQAFHYKNYLPKLLLMAVLINFSRTLVGLMIDFSQVITLTFVNGFKQAAFGNFAKAFNYDKLVNTTDAVKNLADSSSSENLLSLGNIMVTLLFAIAIMSIVATVLTIMMVYFAARIVLLWILLIFSPIAFFALALPDKMKNALGPVSSGWWKQLGSLLTGGPIVAFFLWLTLATIQGSAQPFEGIYQGSTSEQEASSIHIGIAEAGTAGNMATFVVAIIMLLTGLKTAVEVSQQAAPQLGNIASKIRSSGGPATWAARGAYKTARYGAKKTDAAFNVSGRVGSALIRQGQATAESGKLGALSRVAGTSLARAGSRLKTVEAERRGGYEKNLEGRTKHLNPEDRMRLLAAETKGGAGVFASGEMANIAKMKFGEAMSSGSGMKIRQKELEELYLQKNPNDVAGSKAWASGQVKREAGSALDLAIKAAEEAGKGDLADKLKGNREKDPSLHVGFSDLAKIAANRTDDHSSLFKGLKTEAWQDSATFLAMMKAVDLVGDNGSMKDGYEDSEAWQELMKNGGNRARFVKAHALKMETAQGKETAQQQLAAMADGASPELVKAAQSARYNASIQGDNMYFANMAPGGGGGVTMAPMKAVNEGSYDIKNFDDLVQKLEPKVKADMQSALQAVGLNQDSVDRFAKRFDRPITVEQARHVQQNAAAYAHPPVMAAGAVPTADQSRQVAILAKGQSMGVRAPESVQKHVIDFALAQSVSTNVTDRMQGAAAIANVDVAGIKDNPAVQEAVVSAMEGKLDQLGKAFKTSSNDPAALKKIEEVVRNVSNAGQAAAAKALTGQISEVEQRLVKLGEQLRDDKVLKKVTDRKNRGKKS
ncbi:hypothetical protein KBC59_03235 [Patescibacteria group bacterium]|jgi:hypothetical protein|nr:hypothetical protein [Patescibacteria group bacterium]